MLSKSPSEFYINIHCIYLTYKFQTDKELKKSCQFQQWLGGIFKMNMSSYPYEDSHDKDALSPVFYLYRGDYHARKNCLYIETECIYCLPNAKQFREMFVIVELTYVHNAASQVHNSLYKVRMKHVCVWLSNKQRSRTSNMAIGWNWNKQ